MTTPATSVPPVVFGPTGFIAPAESAVLTGVQADMNAAFGGNLNPSLETPQGQLSSSMTAEIGNCNDLFVKLTQQMDPAYADGRMQDGIARIYFLERKPAIATLVTATVTGLAGVVIPAGSIALATDGNKYASATDITIPVGGSTTGTFNCTVTGPIACVAHALNAIYRAIPGWDTIDNAADGVLGQNVESREDFEFRREQSVFLNSVGSNPAVRAAVMAVPGVLDAYVIDNPTASPVSVGGITLGAYSLYVAAIGGDPQLVAQAVWSKKSPGCPYYASANTSETVYDTSAGYGPPYPAYTVLFETPPVLAIYFNVTLALNSGVPVDAATQVTNAIIAAFAGADGGPRARIGSTVYASRFVTAIAALGSWVQIKSIYVGTDSSASANSQAVNINQVPTTATAAIDVVIS
jgi:hypothetical protein